jgi:hypothetical protein
MHIGKWCTGGAKSVRPPNLDIMAGNTAVIGNFIGCQIAHLARRASAPQLASGNGGV